MTTKERTGRTAGAAKIELRRFADRRRAIINAGYFKTGPGEYGEGDRFIGVTVPNVRAVAAKFADLPQEEHAKLLRSGIHEERLLALHIWVLQFRRAGEAEQRRIYRSYLRLRRHVNNWDLVDSSAEQIVGSFLVTRDRAPLYTLARSTRMWDRRIAIVATFHFIRLEDHRETLRLAKLLLDDREDLMHKAVGWMLREVGKRDFNLQHQFIKRHHSHMPRTMLRYAIERYPEPLRSAFLRR